MKVNAVLRLLRSGLSEKINDINILTTVYHGVCTELHRGLKERHSVKLLDPYAIGTVKLVVRLISILIYSKYWELLSEGYHPETDRQSLYPITDILR